MLRTFSGTKMLVLGACLAVSAIGGTDANAQEEPFTLRWASFVSPLSTTNQDTVPAFIAAVEKAAEGTLKIEFYPGGTLGSSPLQQLSMVENGVADIAEVVASYTPGRFPELSVFELPFIVDNNTEASLAANALYEKGLFSGFDDLVVLGFAISGPYGVSSSKRLEGPDALKGMRLRAAGPLQSKITSALGATPMGNMPSPVIAENISRRLLDGTLMAPGMLKAFRIPDAATNHNFDVKLGSVSVLFPMRKDTFEKLPSKAREALKTYSGDWFSRELGAALDSDEAANIEALETDPLQTVTHWSAAQIEEVRERLMPLNAEWDKPGADGVNLYQETIRAIADIRNEG